MLIVSLPLNPNAEVDHLLCVTPEKITHSSRSRVSELPDLSQHTEVVGVIPWQCLSWINLTVPKSALRLFESKTLWLTGPKNASGAQSPKAQNLVQGLLEEQLLCDPSDIHWIAKTPNSSDASDSPHAVNAADNTAILQIGYCSKSWLRMALESLQAVNLTPNQLVPEMEPTPGTPGPTLHALNSLGEITFVLCTPSGVQAFPRSAMGGFSQLKDPLLRVFAEPSSIDSVSMLFGQASLQTAHQRLLASAQSSWDFATGEWDQGPAKKAIRSIKGTIQTFWSAPEWRLARLGLMLAFFTEVLGLNGWAWHLRAAHQEALLSEARILQSTFPSVQLVVDAKLQMARELNALKQNLGEPSLGDFEHLLDVMRQLHDPTQSASAYNPKTNDIQGVQFANQTLKWRYNPNIAFTSLELKLSESMLSKGYQLQKTGSEMVLSWRDAP